MWFCRRTLSVAVLFLVLHNLSLHEVSADGEQCGNTLDGSPGVCVNVRRCAPYITILQKYGTSVGEAVRRTVCYYRESDPIVCCPTGPSGKENGEQEYRPPPPPPQPIQPVQPPQPSFNGSYGPLYEPQCGHTNRRQYDRIVGGVVAELGAYPWLALLGYRDKKQPNTPKWQCGGSLITARHVLTAGHCVFNQHNLYLVRLGEHNIDSDDDGANPINVPIQRGTIHPGYDEQSIVNDIAVLRLRREVTFTPAIQPICLPLPPEIRNKDFVRTTPFVAGWGELKFRTGSRPSILQEVQLPVVSNEECKAAYASYKKQVIDDRVICAGYPLGGKDACRGDSGGPLMAPKSRNGKLVFYAIGVVSFGRGCADAGFPGVYTRVTEFLDFILPLLN